MSAWGTALAAIRPRAQTRNLALLITDIKGFTAQTARQTREENARMLRLHDALLVPPLRALGGRKVKAIGDAMMVVFRSPTDAVLCAMAMQDRLASFNLRTAPDQRIVVRIALSLGEMQVDGSELAGEPVNHAHGALAFADGGEIVLTDAVYLAMNKTEAPTEPLGQTELCGTRVKLHRVRRDASSTLPYGGRAPKTLGPIPEAAPSRLQAFLFPAHGKLGAVATSATRIGLVALAMAAAAGGWAAASLARRPQPVVAAPAPVDPFTAAQRRFAAGEYEGALSELDRLADTAHARSPAVLALRGKAEHALGRVGIAFAEFASAIDVDPRVADDKVISALVSTLARPEFPLEWRPALVKLLGERVGARAADPLRSLLPSLEPSVRGGALQALELAGVASAQDRAAAAAADLRDERTACPDRIRAIHRAVAAPSDDVLAVLREQAAAKRCGAREARLALRHVERAALAGKN